MIHHRLGSLSHSLQEIFLRGMLIPEITLHGARGTGMDEHLARIGSAPDGELLERAAETAHRVPLEVAEHQHGLIVHQMLAHQVLMQHPPVLNGKRHVGAIGIHDVHLEELGPPMRRHQLLVLLGGVARTLVGGVALHDGAIHLFHYGAHELRV